MEFRYHLNFLQNHSFSSIPASFSAVFIEDVCPFWHSYFLRHHNSIIFFNRLPLFKPFNKSTHLYLNNIQTEFLYNLNFIQMHFSFIPAFFSVGLIDLRWRWSVRTFSSVARLGSFSFSCHFICFRPFILS